MPKKIDAANVTELPDGPAGEHGLTARQLKILQVIKASMDDQGFPPSMRAIALAAATGSPAAQAAIDQLAPSLDATSIERVKAWVADFTAPDGTADAGIAAAAARIAASLSVRQLTALR